MSKRVEPDTLTYVVKSKDEEEEEKNEEKYEADFEDDDEDYLNSTQSSSNYLVESLRTHHRRSVSGDESDDEGEKEKKEKNGHSRHDKLINNRLMDDQLPSTSHATLDKPANFTPLPDKLPAIHGLHPALNSLSMDTLRRIHDNCKFRDISNAGILSGQQILQCFAQIVPGATFHSSPWALLIREICPSGQPTDYNNLFKLLAREKFGGFDESKKSLADMLMSSHSSLPTNGHTQAFASEQTIREKGRMQILHDIEALLSRFPQIDFSRLKIATAKKKIEMEELKLILNLHGMESHFRPFFPRLLMSFRTDAGLFHYSAFLESLSKVRIPERSSAPPKDKKILPWKMGPLPPPGSKFEEEEDPPRHISA